MATGPRYAVRFRRSREGRTSYKQRLRLLKSNLPRLIIRKSNKHIFVQIVVFEPKGDKVVAQAKSSELKKLGWKYSTKNIPAAYLTGMLIAKKALTAKVPEAIADIGFYTATKGAKIFAVVKGAADAGLKINYDAKVFPSEDRIAGKHIKNASGLPQDFEAIRQKMK
nr:large subunit ribosomal protein L18 [uncultured archaeon]